MGALANHGVELTDVEAARLLVERVAESDRFQKSPRLREFLLYVARCTLDDRLAEVREQVIAERVFGRKPDVSGQDSIVRAEARNLRKRLEAYFSNEGHDEQTIIVMPKGGYAITFVPRPAGTALDIAESESVVSTVPRTVALLPVEPGFTSSAITSSSITSPAAVRRAYVLALTFGLVAIACAGWAMFSQGQIRHLEQQLGPSQVPFPYSSLFNDRQQTMIVTSDTGLLQITYVLHRRLSLDEYMSRSYGSLPATDPPNLLANWNIYAFTDGREMMVANLLLRENARYARNISLLSGHSVEIENFKDHNAVLIGSPVSNPWAQLFEDRLNFPCILAQQDRISYRNQQPHSSEAGQFPTEEDIQRHRTYARVAFLPAQSSSPATMLIAGTTAEATQTAGELVSDPVWLGDRLRSMGLDQTGAPHFFEFLIRFDNFVGGAIAPEVAAWRLTAPPEH